MPLKITKEDCDLACELLNKEKKKQGGDGTWIKPLIEATNDETTRESVAALSHLIGCNRLMFERLAQIMLPKYLAQHPRLAREQAKATLLDQLIVRFILYIANRQHEAQLMNAVMGFDGALDEE